MKTSTPDAELCGRVVINGTYVKVLKCGNLLMFSHATSATPNTGDSDVNVITITNFDNTTATIELGTDFNGGSVVREFTLPLLYKSIELTVEASPFA
jgi:hypothetical protein